MTRNAGWVRRGDARLLVLEVLKDRQIHGYQVQKAIAQLFGGAYEPSPAVVYPNLQSLEDEGMVESFWRGGRKLYKITEKGRRFAEEGKDEMRRLLEIGRDATKGARWRLMREERQLAKLLAFVMPDITDETARKVVSILKESRERVERLVEPWEQRR